MAPKWCKDALYTHVSGLFVNVTPPFSLALSSSPTVVGMSLTLIESYGSCCALLRFALSARFWQDSLRTYGEAVVMISAQTTCA